MRTEDGGHTWEIVTPPDGTPHVFRDVEAFNPNHAVVLASETGIDSSGQLKPSRISGTRPVQWCGSHRKGQCR